MGRDTGSVAEAICGAVARAARRKAARAGKWRSAIRARSALYRRSHCGAVAKSDLSATGFASAAHLPSVVLCFPLLPLRGGPSRGLH